MKTKIGLVASVCIACTFSALAAEGGEAPGESIRRTRRIIAAGWDYGNVSLSAFAGETNVLARLPLDGIRFSLHGRFKDRKYVASTGKAMDGIDWPWDLFDDQLPAARSIASLPNMRHCFIGARGAPNRRIAWTDDKGWASVAHNFAVLARFARKAGFKGLIVDCEDYGKARQYFLADDDPELGETRRLARQRSREIHSAIFSEYPGITLFRWQFVNPKKEAFEQCEDVTLLNRAGRQSLSVDFINGIYDVMPETARIVAAEEHLYDRLAEKDEFFRGYALEKRFGPEMLDPRHAEKFLMRTSVGFALYLDAFRADNAKSPYYRDPAFYGSPLKCLLANVEQATKITDEYLWLWGELRGWSRWKHKSWSKRKTWEEEFPGLTDGLLRIKDPVGYAYGKLPQLRAAGASNLVDNASCETKRGYGSWQREKRPDARFDVDPAEGCRAPGALRLTDFRGCATKFLDGLKPGERYLLAVRCKVEGDANASVTVSWRCKGKWNFKIKGRILDESVMEKPGWRLLTGMIVVPDTIDGMGICLGAESRKGQRVWFDDLEVYRLD